MITNYSTKKRKTFRGVCRKRTGNAWERLGPPRFSAACLLVFLVFLLFYERLGTPNFSLACLLFWRFRFYGNAWERRTSVRHVFFLSSFSVPSVFSVLSVRNLFSRHASFKIGVPSDGDIGVVQAMGCNQETRPESIARFLAHIVIAA